MAITKEKKQQIVEKLEGVTKNASTIVFAKFKGLTVAEQTEMRKALKSKEVDYMVTKKTLLNRALEKAGFGGEAPTLEGEVAIAYGKDELAPARELATFVKKFAEHLAFAGGIFGGKYMSREEIIGIASIPGADTLRAMFAQIINSPRQRFAVVLSEVAKTKAN